MPSRFPATLAALTLAWAVLAALPTTAHAIGLMVVKGANASPEYAKVVPFGRYDQFAVSYKVQVTGRGEQIFLVSEVFGVVEYDPSLLTADLIDPLDLAPIMEVIAKTQALADRYPALRAEAPRFLKPLQEAVSYIDQGLVQYRGGWMRKERYQEILHAQRQELKDSQELARMVERAQKAELERREAEARAQTALAADKVRAQARAEEAAEKQRQMETRRQQEEQARIEEKRAAQRQEQAAQLRQFEQNLLELAQTKGTLGSMLRAEWETLVEASASPRSASWHFQGFPLAKAAATLLTTQHFPQAPVEVPPLHAPRQSEETNPGTDTSSAPATAAWMQAADSSAAWILIKSPAASTQACLIGFEVPVDATSNLAAGPETTRITAVLGDISRDLVRQLPRALSTCRTSLPRTGALSLRAPLLAGEIPGYLALTRPLLGPGGQQHVIVLIALGFTQSPPTTADAADASSIDPTPQTGVITR